MIAIYQTGKLYLRLVAIPLFVFICLNFLSRSSLLGGIKDTLLSFAFIELLAMGLALFLSFSLAIFHILAWRRGLKEMVEFLALWSFLFIFLWYFKKWILFFTLGEGIFSRLGISENLLISLIATSVLGFLFFKNRTNSLRKIVAEAARRLSLLILIVSGASFLALAFQSAKTILRSHPESMTRTEMDRPNILLLVIDTLSARHLSTYGYKKNQTPTFDKMAREGYFVVNARANIPSTSPNILGMLSGRSPLLSHIISFKSVPTEMVNMNLLSILESVGYKTASVADVQYAATEFFGFPPPTEGEIYVGEILSHKINLILASYGKKLGFVMKFRFLPFKIERLTSASYFNALLDNLILLEKSPQPFFQYAHYFLPKYFSEGYEHSEVNYPKYCHSYSKDQQPFIDHSRQIYDDAVSELDKNLGVFFENLESQGIMSDTVVIVTADHGDSYEKGFWGHGYDLSENVIHVPMMILTPERVREKILHPVESCDIAPTILQLVGLEKPEWMDCVSIFDEDQPRQSAITFNLLTDGHSIREEVKFPGLSAGRSIAFYKDSFKYIERPAGEENELYDLANDAEENENVISRMPDKAKILREELMEMLNGDPPL